MVGPTDGVFPLDPLRRISSDLSGDDQHTSSDSLTEDPIPEKGLPEKLPKKDQNLETLKKEEKIARKGFYKEFFNTLATFSVACLGVSSLFAVPVGVISLVAMGFGPGLLVVGMLLTILGTMATTAFVFAVLTAKKDQELDQLAGSGDKKLRESIKEILLGTEKRKEESGSPVAGLLGTFLCFSVVPGLLISNGMQLFGIYLQEKSKRDALNKYGLVSPAVLFPQGENSQYDREIVKTDRKRLEQDLKEAYALYNEGQPQSKHLTLESVFARQKQRGVLEGLRDEEYYRIGYEALRTNRIQAGITESLQHKIAAVPQLFVQAKNKAKEKVGKMFKKS